MDGAVGGWDGAVVCSGWEVERTGVVCEVAESLRVDCETRHSEVRMERPWCWTELYVEGMGMDRFTSVFDTDGDDADELE